MSQPSLTDRIREALEHGHRGEVYSPRLVADILDRLQPILDAHEAEQAEARRELIETVRTLVRPL